MVLRNPDYSFKVEVQDVVDYLSDNLAVILNDLKREFKDQLTRGKTYAGYRRTLFEKHVETGIRQKLRAMYAEELKLNSEESLVVQFEDEVDSLTSIIIQKVMESV